jgi:hypothetical protein
MMGESMGARGEKKSAAAAPRAMAAATARSATNAAPHGARRLPAASISVVGFLVPFDLVGVAGCSALFSAPFFRSVRVRGCGQLRLSGRGGRDTVAAVGWQARSRTFYGCQRRWPGLTCYCTGSNCFVSYLCYAFKVWSSFVGAIFPPLNNANDCCACKRLPIIES